MLIKGFNFREGGVIKSLKKVLNMDYFNSFDLY